MPQLRGNEPILGLNRTVLPNEGSQCTPKTSNSLHRELEKVKSPEFWGTMDDFACWQPIQFFQLPLSCLHLCLLNFKFLSHFANRRHFHFKRHLQIGFDLFFTTKSVKTPPSLFGLS
jgi:hypothetical protein